MLQAGIGFDFVFILYLMIFFFKFMLHITFSTEHSDAFFILEKEMIFLPSKKKCLDVLFNFEIDHVINEQMFQKLI